MMAAFTTPADNNKLQTLINEAAETQQALIGAVLRGDPSKDRRACQQDYRDACAALTKFILEQRLNIRFVDQKAEALAKAVLISGSEAGLAWLDGDDSLAGLLLLDNGQRLYSRNMSLYL